MICECKNIVKDLQLYDPSYKNKVNIIESLFFRFEVIGMKYNDKCIEIIRSKPMQKNSCKTIRSHRDIEIILNNMSRKYSNKDSSMKIF